MEITIMIVRRGNFLQTRYSVNTHVNITMAIMATLVEPLLIGSRQSVTRHANNNTQSIIFPRFLKKSLTGVKDDNFNVSLSLHFFNPLSPQERASPVGMNFVEPSGNPSHHPVIAEQARKAANPS